MKSELESSDGILNLLHIGLNSIFTIFVIPLTLKIDIITENKTTNPPIIKIVEVAEDMALARFSPNVETEIGCNLFSNSDVLYIILGLLFLFQNLNIKPTVKHARI